MERVSKADLAIFGGRSASLGDASEVLPRLSNHPSSFKSPFQDEADDSGPAAILPRLAHRPFLQHKEDLASFPITLRTTLQNVTLEKGEKVQQDSPGRDRKPRNNDNAKQAHKGKELRRDPSPGHNSELAPAQNDNKASGLDPSDPKDDEKDKYLLQDLIYACHGNASAQARDCIEGLRRKGISLDEVMPNGQGLLHMACRHHDAHILRLILPHFDQSSLNRTNKEGQSPLAIALSTDSFACAEILLSSRVDPFISIGNDKEISSRMLKKGDNGKAVLKSLLEARDLRRKWAKGLLGSHQSGEIPSATESRVSSVHADSGTWANTPPSFHMHYTISEDHTQGTVQTILARFGKHLERKNTYEDKRLSDQGCASGIKPQGQHDVNAIMRQAESFFMTGEYSACAHLCSEAITTGEQVSADPNVAAHLFELEGSAFEHSNQKLRALRSYRKSLKACWDNDLAKRVEITELCLILKENGWLEKSDEPNLSMACCGTDIELVKYFHELNPEHLNAHGGNGWAPLHRAVGDKYATLEIVEYLLQQGASPNLEGAYSHTPLSLAVQNGYPHLVEVLLRYGANPDIMEPGKSHWAVEASFQQAISLLRRAREGDPRELKEEALFREEH
jgi:ankyrin repeat protein